MAGTRASGTKIPWILTVNPKTVLSYLCLDRGVAACTMQEDPGMVLGF